MKKEAKSLLQKSTESVLLAVEHFNRHLNTGRHEAVLIFLDRGFELLLKSIIVFKNGKIREGGTKQTIGFNSCVRKCVSEQDHKCITENEAITIQIINSLRDAAQHHILELSEQQLYLYTQSGLTIYDKILREIYNTTLTDYLPERVLPVSANPPKEFHTLMNVEFSYIKESVQSGKRQTLDAKSKLLPFAIIESSLGGSHAQPTERELDKISNRIKNGEDWTDIFPSIQRLSISPEGKGFVVSLRITKKEGTPVYVVPENTPGSTPLAIKRVNELEFYSLNLDMLAQKLKLTSPRLLAVIWELKIQDEPDCYKQIQINSTKFKRYSALALDKIYNLLPSLDLQEVWSKHKVHLTGTKKDKLKKKRHNSS